ncbi:MAG: hypothetical protein ABSG94_11505 [Brevinematales bacterium]
MNNSINSSLFIKFSENSCSFVGYLDYSSTSKTAVSNTIKINSIPYIAEYFPNEIPNNETLEAINESRNPNSLQTYKNFETFLTSLEG